MTELTTPVALAEVRAPATRGAGADLEERIWAGAWACTALALLILSSILHPSHDGYGTHQQLGLPACVWMATFNAPCPTCGMTTAFTCAAHGLYERSFLVQPFGAVLAIGAATTFWFALHTALTGSRALTMALRALGTKAIWLGLLGLLGAWAYTLVRYSA